MKNLNRRNIYLSSISLFLCYLIFSSQSINNFANQLYLQDLTIYLRSLDYDLKNSRESFPHQTKYVKGLWGGFDKSSAPLRNWGMPVSALSILPFWLLGQDLWKLVYVALLFITPIAIVRLGKSHNIAMTFFLILGPILSNLFWGGLGSILVTYVYLICKYSKTYLAHLLLAVLFLYKPQFVAPVVVYLTAASLARGKWKLLLPSVCSVVIILGISVIWFPKSWIDWTHRDFSIPLQYIAATPGVSTLLRLVGIEKVYLFAPSFFLITIVIAARLGRMSKYDNLDLINQKALAIFSLGVVLSPYVWLHDWIVTSLGVVSGLCLYLLNNKKRSTKILIYLSLFLVCISEVVYVWYSEPILIVLPFLTRLTFILYFLFSCDHMHNITNKKWDDGPRGFHKEIAHE